MLELDQYHLRNWWSIVIAALQFDNLKSCVFSSSFFFPIHLLQVDATKDMGQSARVHAAETTEALEAASVEVTENIVSHKLLN